MDMKICFLILVVLIVLGLIAQILFQHETNLTLECIKQLLLHQPDDFNHRD